MSEWIIKLVPAVAGLRTQDDLTSADKERDVSAYITSFGWTHSIRDPYMSASASLLVPLRDLGELVGLGRVDDRGVFHPHASAWLVIYERHKSQVYTRHYGPISSVTYGVETNSATGARETARFTLQSSSWLTPLQRGFRVSANSRLNVAGSVITLDEWAKIAEAVFASASTSISDAFKTAFESFATPLQVSPFADALDATEHTRTREINGEPTATPAIRVQGRNLSQLQPPPFRATQWDILRQTFSPTDLIELYPTWLQDVRAGRSRAAVVYRLAPIRPSLVADKGESYIKSLSLSLPDAPFLDDAQGGEPPSIPSVTRYSLTHSQQRNNYIEVTSPYTGTSDFAGLTSDPAILQDDVGVYGLYEYSTEYPFFRDTEASVRVSINQMTTYATLLKAAAHRYAQGTVEAKYTDGQSIAHGDWVRWLSYGEGSSTFEAYCVSVSHSFKVNREGVLEGRSTYSVERVEALA